MKHWIQTILYWTLQLLLFAGSIICVGTILGTVIAAVCSTIVPYSGSLIDFCLQGSWIGFRYAGVWAGGLAIVLCFIKGNHLKTQQS